MKTSRALAALALTFVFSQTAVLAQTVASAKTYVRHEPDGKGDPAAITCRRPQPLAGQRNLGPEVCRPNAEWAQFAKQGMTVAPDGINLVPSEKARSLNPAACGPSAGSAPTSSAGMASRGGMSC